MEKQKLQISDDEIVVNISTKKTGFWGIIISIIIFACVAGLSGFVGSKYNYLFQPNYAIILGLLTGFFLSNRLIWLSQKQYMMTFDKKHIVIYDSVHRYRGRVFKMEEIRSWCIDSNYRLTPWTHISAFFTKGAGGCIAFNYTDAKMPIYIGYGLMPSEAEELLGVIREKGWISDFQLSDTTLEYKKNRMKYALWLVISLLIIYFVLIVILKEPYKKENFFIQGRLLTIIFLFSFIMAIVSSRQNRKNKSKKPNA